MPTDWKSHENLERLVAAIIASNGHKVSIHLHLTATSITDYFL
jgi:hypothetical protein